MLQLEENSFLGSLRILGVGLDQEAKTAKEAKEGKEGQGSQGNQERKARGTRPQEAMTSKGSQGRQRRPRNNSFFDHEVMEAKEGSHIWPYAGLGPGKRSRGTYYTVPSEFYCTKYSVCLNSGLRAAFRVLILGAVQHGVLHHGHL